ncbi:MAG TPA: SDR family oxidoreductase [bacterium]|nr:SDR family oxidoreductase [bacterium]
MRTDDTIVLITGASRGLGREVARLLAARGAGLILTARGAGALEDAVAGLRDVASRSGAAGEILAVAGDVADAAHAERLVRDGLARFGHIDVLINNASTLGASPMPRLEALDPRIFEEIFRINVAAPLRLIQLVLPQMKARRTGVIINVTSDAAVEAYPGWGGYGASKAALEHLTRILAAELDGTGVRAYIVDPGEMNTRMHRDAEPGVDLSHLPPPEVSAPAFLQLVEDETAAFGRFAAQRMPVGPRLTRGMQRGQVR